ncbi:MAG: 5'-methylthioadenosine/adenosylhomocysteine nucleosidase [Ruminococcaceae bacterium]|nr:5'-methylthioadenosine/adenosylhomocysteine nucleosidase [Oscillospiraceae bacterium]
MKLGIIGAMKIEVDAIAAALTEKKTEICGGIEYITGKIGECEVVCAVCGVGKVFAAMCAQAMIIRFAPDAVVNTGVGGSLTRELSIGDIAVSSTVVQHDMDTSALGDPVGLISGLDLVHLSADDELCNKIIAILGKMGINCRRGTIASGDQFVCDGAVKAKIVERFSAIACEMEGAAIGQVCTVNRVPFCVIRAISDNADTGACEDFPTFAAKAAKNSAEAVITLAGSF